MHLLKLSGRAPGGHALAWMLAVVVAPVFEEIFFRGLLVRRMLKQQRPSVAAIVSALLFALAHIDPVNLWMYFLFGWALSWLYIRTGSLVAAIVAHSGANLIFLAGLLLF
jgi:hypothetical protein